MHREPLESYVGVGFRADELSDYALLDRLAIRMDRGDDSHRVGWGRADLRYAIAARLQGVRGARARRVVEYPDDWVTLRSLDQWISRAESLLRRRAFV